MVNGPKKVHTGSYLNSMLKKRIRHCARFLNPLSATMASVPTSIKIGSNPILRRPKINRNFRNSETSYAKILSRIGPN